MYSRLPFLCMSIGKVNSLRGYCNSKTDTSCGKKEKLVFNGCG